MNTQQLSNLINFIAELQLYTIVSGGLITILVYFIYSLFLKKSAVSHKMLVTGTIIVGSLRIILAFVFGILRGIILTPDLRPPLMPFSYVAGYVWTNAIKGMVFTVFGTLVLFFLLKLINKMGHDRFFYEEEYWLAALGCLTVGWPNLILYFFLAAFLNVFAHIIAMAIKKEGRISLLYMWPIAMIITIIFGNKLATLTGLIHLKP